MFEWDNQRISIWVLSKANLSPYNRLVGLIRARLNGKIVYIGRTYYFSNGGLRKRLSNYY